MKRAALVVPTIRKQSIIEFIEAWGNQEAQEYWDVIIVEDNPETTFRVGNISQHFSWKEIDEILQKDSWIISRRDSAIRSFGFYYAYKKGYEEIITLDDDCAPLDHPHTFYNKHLRNLNHFSKWSYSVPGQRTRGFPYGDLGINSNVKVSMGLWENVPDYDAIQELSGNNPELVLPTESYLMPNGQYFPFCGMNVCFKREAAPLMYFPLQGEGYPYRRFDDIWCGIILKKICDHLGWQIAVGPPHINHTRASDKFVNLQKEAPGIAFHDTFWKAIDEIQLTGENAIVCVRELGMKLANKTKSREYLNTVGSALVTWANLFDSNSN